MRRRLWSSTWRKNVVGRKLTLLKPSSPVAPGTHPCAFVLSPEGKTLYVALANRDVVAAVNVGAGQFAVKGYFDTRLPGQSYFGAEPEALALNANGSRLYVANAISDAVAVIDTGKLTARSAKRGMVEPNGFVPTEWMPMSMAFLPSPSGGTLYVATAKGKGTGPNKIIQRADSEAEKRTWPLKRPTYIATLLYGSLAALDAGEIDTDLRAIDRGGARVEPHEGGGGKDQVCGRCDGSNQARDLHHQGEPHLRSDSWRPCSRAESRSEMAIRA